MSQPYCGVRATCTACHKQQEVLLGDFDEADALRLAGLMDGTSPMFQRAPGPDSVIGACGFCGKRIRCEVFGYSKPDRVEVRHG